MIRLTVLAILIFALNSFASGAGLHIMNQPEDAFELVLGEVTLPSSAGGTVIFKSCSECRTTALRTTASTVFQVNGETVDFETFRKAAKAYRASGGDPLDTAVYLFFNVDSRLVTRMKLDSV